MSAKPQEDFLPVYSSPQWVGKSLREVGRDFLSADSQTVTSRWFHGAQESDLFIWVDGSSRLIKGQLTFCGAVVEWNVMEGLRTGLIVEEEHQNLNPSEVIQFDRNPDGRHVLFAALVVESVPGLEDEIKVVFARLLRSQSRN
ncbi:MAG: hypothetical protein K2X47_18140, partial [Bdellovibrionales bacterium]|nr:hypothetical protein [Bdellovibrionales bacterium]